LGQVLEDRKNSLEERSFVKVHAQQLGRLAHQDNQTYARLETGQDRVGDKVGDKAHPKDTGQEQEGPHQ